MPLRLIFLFLASILIRSIKTVQNISMNAGHRYFSAVLIGIDTLFFLLVFKNVIDNELTVFVVLAVAAGYILGFLLGTYVEERIALGKLFVTIKIPKSHAKELSETLRKNGFVFVQSKRFYSHKGKLKKIFQGVIYRKELPKLKKITKDFRIIGTAENLKTTFGRKLLTTKEYLNAQSSISE
ncbi:hypothetical protein ACFLZX_04410 [Nanoarchaeota archaeon]